MFLEITLNIFFTAAFHSPTGSLSSRLLRNVLAPQRSLSYPHFIFPTTTQNIVKIVVRFTVVVTVLVCPKTLLSNSSLR